MPKQKGHFNTLVLCIEMAFIIFYKIDYVFLITTGQINLKIGPINSMCPSFPVVLYISVYSYILSFIIIKVEYGLCCFK